MGSSYIFDPKIKGKDIVSANCGWATFGQVWFRPISTVLGKSFGVSAALGWN